MGMRQDRSGTAQMRGTKITPRGQVSHYIWRNLGQRDKPATITTRREGGHLLRPEKDAREAQSFAVPA